MYYLPESKKKIDFCQKTEKKNFPHYKSYLAQCKSLL